MNLKIIKLAANTTTIDSYAFENCSSLGYFRYEGLRSNWNAMGSWGGLEDIPGLGGSTSDQPSIIYNGSDWGF